MNKILLVEDDEAEQRLYQKLLTLEGFDVVTINNGQECRAKALEVKPDIILLDIMMPKVNGFEALDVLQFDPETKKVPVVMLSNLSDENYKEEARRHGAVQYFVKSQIENKQLVNTIRDIIRVSQSNLKATV